MAAGVDVLFPLVPSETIVIAASVLAGQGELLIVAIVSSATLGAIVGDNVSYWLGRRLGMPYRRFLVADVAAATAWALYVSMLGFVGGASFEDNVWLPLACALGLTLLVAAGAEAWRRRQRVE